MMLGHNLRKELILTFNLHNLRVILLKTSFFAFDYKLKSEDGIDLSDNMKQPKGFKGHDHIRYFAGSNNLRDDL